MDVSVVLIAYVIMVVVGVIIGIIVGFHEPIVAPQSFRLNAKGI